jgi:hypothetical protein
MKKKKQSVQIMTKSLKKKRTSKEEDAMRRAVKKLNK